MYYLDFVYYFVVYHDRLAKHTNPSPGGTYPSGKRLLQIHERPQISGTIINSIYSVQARTPIRCETFNI